MDPVRADNPGEVFGVVKPDVFTGTSRAEGLCQDWASLVLGLEVWAGDISLWLVLQVFPCCEGLGTPIWKN